MADQEGEVELLQHLPWDDSRVAAVDRRLVRVGRRWAPRRGRRARRRGIHRRLGRTRNIYCRVLSGGTITAVGVVGTVVRSDATLFHVQRGSDAGRLLPGRYEVVGDVFDEDALALMVAMSALTGRAKNFR